MADTPKPMEGTWTLTAPDGRTWQAESPLRCAAAEQRERIPATVRLQRILDAADEPTEREKTLALLVKRLCRRLAPDDNLREGATDYLRREGLLGSPLRQTPAGVAASDGKTVAREAAAPSPVNPPEFQEATWGFDSVMRPCKSPAISEYSFRQWAKDVGIVLADEAATPQAAAPASDE